MKALTEKPVTELTARELKALLAEKEKEERELRATEEKEYKEERDKNIDALMKEAEYLGERISAFKRLCHDVMAQQASKLDGYGQMRGNSKGGFSITHSDGTKRIVRRRDTEPFWDERAEKAIGLVKEFLYDTVKKRDLKLFEILLSFLEKNKAGDLEYSRVFALLKHEGKFNDDRWIEGLRLLKESFSTTLKAYGYEFKRTDDSGNWQSIVLNFSSL